MQSNKAVQRFLCSLVILCLGWGCPGGSPDHDAKLLSQTTLAGRAPLNANGEVRILRADSREYLQTVKTDEAGRFEAQLGAGQGSFLLEAWGGSYQEPASGNTVHVDGERLRAAVFDVGLAQSPFVVISPWTEMAVASVETGDLAIYQRVLKELTSLLTCNDTNLGDVLTVSPSMQTENAPIQSLTSGALAYVYQGGWSQLAADLSDEAGVQPGARITSMRLARLVASDLADGHIDGAKAGASIELANNFYLPPNILRQRLAQAVRHFLNSPANVSSLRSNALLDLLRCLSANNNVTFGRAGELLDLDPPEVNIIAPRATILAGQQQLSCEAKDASTLVNMASEARKGGELQNNLLGQPVVQLKGNHASVLTELRLPSENEDFDLTCSATDQWGNKGEAKIAVAVNGRGGVPSVYVSPHENGEIRGQVEVRCTCDDRFPEACELTEPDPAATAGMRLVRQSPKESLYRWFTPDVLDGTRAMTCTDRSTAFGSTESTVHVMVNNVEPGSVEGWVSVDSPVRQITVQAYSYLDGVRGRLLGSQKSATGFFTVSMADDYRGPVLLEATGVVESESRPGFSSAVIDDTIDLGDGRLTLLLDHYEPGQRLQGLSINILSSLAEAYTKALYTNKPVWLEDSSFSSASRRAHLLWGQHLRPDRTLDVRHTVGQNFSEPGASSSFDQVLVGLFHAGLSRLAVEYSWYEYSVPQALSATKLLDYMRQDLRDGLLDGLDHGEQIFVTRERLLGDQFVRYELALGIRRWLNRTSLSTDLPTRNVTPFTAQQFSRRGQLLRVLSGNESELFGPRRGREFDLDGPDIQAHLEDPSRNQVNLEKALHGPLYVVASAVDESSVESISAKVGETVLLSRETGRPDYREFYLDTRNFPDGPLQVIVTARDRLQNPNELVIDLEIDNTLPVVTLSGSYAWVKDANPLMISGFLSKPCQYLDVYVGADRLHHLENPVSTFDISMPLNCNQSHLMRFVAVDHAGNLASQEKVVRCDDQPPNIHINGSFVRHDGSGQPYPLDERVWTSTPEFEKFFNQLDAGTDNLPTLKFRVDDNEPNGTSSQDLTVFYRYEYEGHEGNFVRDWSRLAPAQEYEIAVSYQNLLPRSMLERGRQHAIAHNFIGRSLPSDKHYLDIRVVDLAGNVREKRLPFRIKLQSPPLSISGCEGSPEARNLSLSGLTLHNLYQPNYLVDEADILWNVAYPANSLAPQGQMHVVVDVPGADTVIGEWEIDVYRDKSTSEARIAAMTAAQVRCGHRPSHTIGWSDGTCQLAPSKDNAYPRNWSHGEHQASSNQSLALTFSGLDGTPVPGASNHSVMLNSSSQYKMRLRNAGSLKRDDGTSFDWPQEVNTAGRPIYRWKYRQGYELHRPWNNRHEIYFGERTGIRRLTYSRQAMTFKVLPMGETPSPSAINIGSSCTRPLFYVWIPEIASATTF